MGDRGIDLRLIFPRALEEMLLRVMMGLRRSQVSLLDESTHQRVIMRQLLLCGYLQLSSIWQTRDDPQHRIELRDSLGEFPTREYL